MRGYKLAGEEKFDPGDVLASIWNVLPKERPIRHHEPFLGSKEREYIDDCLSRGLTGYEYVERFENGLARRCGVDYCVATNSGTAALHVALLASGVKPDHEVLVPTLTFTATANAVRYCGAWPVFLDGTLGVNAHKLRCYLERETSSTEDRRGRRNKTTGRLIVAIIPVYLLGSSIEAARVAAVANQFGLEVIEDAAEALGTLDGNRHAGTHGLAGILSFNNNKIATTNGGGAVLTNDEWVAAKCRQLISVARVPHPWLIEHDGLGFNYSMGNINAAIGMAQLERLDGLVSAKQQLADRYRRSCANTPGIQFCEHGSGSNNWLNAILVDPRWVGGRDDILRLLHDDGILARAMFTPVHTLPYYQDCNSDNNLIYAEDMARRLICLPSSPKLVQ